MSTTQPQLCAMTVAQRLKIANNIYISYPRFKEILGAIEYCHHFSCCKDEPECMFLSGPTGVGKTTIYRTYASKYPRQITPEGTNIPILAVTIPAPATVKTSDGVIAYVMKLIRYGTYLALQQHREQLDLGILAVAFEKYVHADKAGKVNPFLSDEFQLQEPEAQSALAIGATNNRLKSKPKKPKASSILTTR